MSKTSPNMKNSLLPWLLRVREHLRPELLPELVVDVLHGVDPEAVDAEVADPGLVDVDHPVDHLGCSVNRSSSPKKSP